MSFIFVGSTGTLSGKNTSRILVPFLRWLVPNISDDALENAQLVVRKCGHLTEYAVLAAFFWIACRKPRRHDPRPWSWHVAGLALGLAFLYAVSDELHQALVPSRFGSPWDVLIDTCGAAAGLLLLYLWHRLRRPP